MKKNPITREEVKKRISGLPIETQREMVCALVGHSHLLTQCFGYHYCARCGDQVGDSLGGSFRDEENKMKLAIINCACDKCSDSYAAFTWKDLFLVPDEHIKTAKEQFSKAE